MPKLKTNKTRNVIGPSTSREHICISTYMEYVSQREEQNDVTKEKIDELTEKYKLRISQPLHALSPSIEMGEYFVIPVTELREMLDADSKAEFIHICNALRDVRNTQGELKTFPVTILVPFQKNIVNNEEVFEACKSDNSVYVEAYPCPPDPRCPIGPGAGHINIFENIFKPNTKFNQFNALF